MKKAVSIFLIFIAFLFTYFLQSNFFTWFNIAGVKPNLFIILILVIGLYGGKYVGITTGIVSGLLIDIFMSKEIGITAILLGAVGLLGAVLDKNFSKDSKFMVILMVVVTTIAYEFIGYVINIMLYNYSFEMLALLRKILIEALFNIFLTIIFYPLIQKAGYGLEETYKQTKILTRYF